MNKQSAGCLLAAGGFAFSQLFGACRGDEVSNTNTSYTNTGCNPQKVVIQENYPQEGISTVSKVVSSKMEGGVCNTQYSQTQVNETYACVQNFPQRIFTGPTITGYYEQNGQLFVRIACYNSGGGELSVDWPIN